MTKYQIAGFLVAMSVFAACDDDGDSKLVDGGLDGGSGDAAPVDGKQSGSDANLGGGDAGGGDTGGGPGPGIPPFSSGVAGTKIVANLTPAEQQQICAAAERWVKSDKVRLENGLCNFGGFLNASIVVALGADLATARASCQEAVTKCLADNGEPDKCEVAPPSCNITVAELEKCRTDQLLQLKAITDQVPVCGMIKLSDFSSGGPKLPQTAPASCTSVESKCPGLSDSFEDEMPE